MPTLKTKASRRFFRGAWILLAALVFLEAGLRVIEALAPAANPAPAAMGDTLLLVGDSQLADGAVAKRLAEFFSGGGPKVVNLAARGRNSSELLAILPAELEETHPKALVVMIGDANFWNYHHLSFFLDARPTVLGFFSQLRISRLFGKAPEFFPVPRAGYSVFFRDVPLAEFPTLAMRWAGYLSARDGARDLSDPEALEADQALRRWIADSRSGDQPIAVRALVTLSRARGRGDYARRVEQEYLVRNPPHLAIYRDPGGTAKLAAEAARLSKRGRKAEARSRLRESVMLNPFSAGGEPPSYEFYEELSPVAFRDLVTEALPPAVAAPEKPGLRDLRESFLDPAIPPEWLARDLGALVRLARRRGIAVVLATYPPERYSGRERPADAVIRRVAGSLDVPLSDISGELRREWDGRALEKFYAAGDSLNQEGSGLLAGILLRDLRQHRIVQ